jgi:hypothetical protein
MSIIFAKETMGPSRTSAAPHSSQKRKGWKLLDLSKNHTEIPKIQKIMKNPKNPRNLPKILKI